MCSHYGHQLSVVSARTSTGFPQYIRTTGGQESLESVLEMDGFIVYATSVRTTALF